VYLGAALYKRGKFVVMENVSFESHQETIVLPVISNAAATPNYAQVMLNSKASDAAIAGGVALVQPPNGSDEVVVRTNIAANKPAAGLGNGSFADLATAKAAMKSGEAGFYLDAQVPGVAQDAAHYPAGLKMKNNQYFLDQKMSSTCA